MRFFRIPVIRVCISRIILVAIILNTFLPVIGQNIEKSRDGITTLGSIVWFDKNINRAPREQESDGASGIPISVFQEQ